MKTAVGIDLGKRNWQAARVGGTTIERSKGTTDEVGLTKLCRWLQDGDIIGVETGSTTRPVVQFIRERVNCTIHVMDARKLPIIYQSTKKTDKEDCLKLAKLVQLFPAEDLPTVYLPNNEEQEHRQIVSEQEQVTKARTSSLNALYSIFARAGMTGVSKGELRSANRRNALINQLNGYNKTSADFLNRTIALQETRLEELEQLMKDILQQHPDFTKIHFSIPGFGLISTFVYFAYINDGSRFTTGDQVAAYAGFVPRVDISGDQVRIGRIIKGNHALKRILIQCAWTLVRTDDAGPLKQFFNLQAPRIGKKKAVVAVARKMLKTAFALHKYEQMYNGTDWGYTEKKLKRSGLIEKVA